MKKLALFALGMTTASLAFGQQSVAAYTTLEEPHAKQLFERFEKDTGIKVNWQRLAGGEVESRLEAEKANPQASIWVGGVGLNHMSAKAKGLTAPYKSRAADNTPAQYRDKDNFWIGLYVGPLAFITNEKVAKEQGLTPPKSWADLLKPEYKNKVRVANPTTSGTAYNVITTMRYVFKGDEEKTFDYLRKMDASINQYTKSGAAGNKSVAIGEIPVAIGYAHDMVKLKVEGAPVVITVPSEGTGYEVASMSLVKGGKDAVNAKKLYDWVLTKPAQDLIGSWYVVPLSKLAEKNPVAFSLEDVKTVNQDLQWDAENKTRLLERWTKEIGSKR
ncbi:MAG: ABC transporter substrate-binding protein [Propionivibrio sp.]